MTDSEVDNTILTFLPPAGGHLFYSGVLLRLRECVEWSIEKWEADHLVHASLNRLERSGKVTVGNHIASPLFYFRSREHGKA